MRVPPDNQPARSVVEEPRRSLPPYLLVVALVAVLLWKYSQDDVVEPGQSKSAPAPRSEAAAHKLDSKTGDLRTVFTADDYPVEALARSEQGTAQAELGIDARGVVSSCTIIRSSGSAALDAATCNILRKRAKFRPARDANGVAVSDKVVTPPITWRLEG